MRSPLIAAVLIAFAAGALTRVVVNDAIFDGPREMLASSEWLEKLVTCPWCVSFWITLGLSLVAWADGYDVDPLVMLAAWAGAKLVYWRTEALAAAASAE